MTLNGDGVPRAGAGDGGAGGGIQASVHCAGDGADLLRDLEQTIAAYVAAGDGQFRGLGLHIGARHDMRAQMKELTAIVRLVDAVVRIVWAGNVEVLSVWKAASDMVYPRVGREEETGELRLVGAGEVQPAA